MGQPVAVSWQKESSDLDFCKFQKAFEARRREMGMKSTNVR